MATLAAPGKQGTVLTKVMLGRVGSENTIHRYAATAWRWMPAVGRSSSSPNPVAAQAGYKTYWG